MPIRLDWGVTSHSWALSSASDSCANQSARGPITTSRQTTSPALGMANDGCSASATGASPLPLPTCSASPAASGAGPTRASVSVAALASTGVTDQPPRTAT
ncbi:hypothetical protein D3C78_1511050 [compost metagenome]